MSVEAQVADTTKIDRQKENELPTITLSSEDLESGEQSTDISGLLQSSKDAFTSAAGYTFGPARFRIRGYRSEYTSILINAVPVNDMESGAAYWSTWGGLNDATRNSEIQTGISVSDNSFGRIGGVTNIVTRASEYRKQTKFTYSAGNRSYTNRLMFIHSTGMMDNGWAFSISGSRRWAQEGYVDGTFYDAWSYFVAAEKKINSAHSIAFTAFGAPRINARSGVSTQEAYDLSGSNYYNPYWGYQSGEKRNSRVNNYHKPMAILNHYWDINTKSKLNSSLSYSFGKGGSTALNWFSGADPRPDYYRNLPSYYAFDPVQYDNYLDLWQNNSDYNQINWDRFYTSNANSRYIFEDVDGIVGNNITALRSNYILEERRNDHSQVNLNSNYKNDINENIKINAGLNVNLYQGFHFKVVNDLLGGDYWLDIDKYAERDFAYVDPTISQSDLNNPNRLVEVGDKFGYDYNSNIHKYEVFTQAVFSYAKFDFFAGIDLSQTSFWRTGNMQTGLFPDNSYGDGEKHNFFNYEAKGGLTYKINGRNFVSVNSTYLTQAPYFRNAYLSPRTRDGVVEDLESESIFSGDISYILKSPMVKARVSAYYTEFKDQIYVRGVFFDQLNTYGNYIMQGMDKLHYGVEAGLEVNVSPTMVATFAGAKGLYIYNSRPEVTIVQDNNQEILLENEVAYIKNYRLANGPQTVATVGLKYNAPKYWYVGVNANYFDDMYIDINPYRRTEVALEGLVVSDPQWSQMIDQEKLPWAYTIDFFGGKSWKIKEYYIALNLNMSNVLNNKNFITGGFEQLRVDISNPDKFPNKYFYLYGATYFVNLNFRF